MSDNNIEYLINKVDKHDANDTDIAVKVARLEERLISIDNKFDTAITQLVSNDSLLTKIVDKLDKKVAGITYISSFCIVVLLPFAIILFDHFLK